jgi:hypothetical protein
MNKGDLHVLTSFLEFENERVTNYFKSKLRELIRENENEFFECVFRGPDENFLAENSQIQPTWQEHLTFHIRLSDPGWIVAVVYKPQNFSAPFCVFTITDDQLQYFSKFEEFKSFYESISYFEQTSLELRRFLKEESQKYTLSEMLRTYPELHEFTKRRFRFRFKLGPYKDPKKLKRLPEHLGDYVRKAQFICKVCNT